MTAGDNVIPITRGSARRHVAFYLSRYVGEGNVFSIRELELAVEHLSGGPRRVELDRRVRELRVVGWRIDTYRHDGSLKSSEHRLVRIGDPVWDKSYRWPTQRTHCSALVRRAVFQRDDRECSICGIKAGEPYPDQPQRLARMTVGRIIPGSAGGAYTLENCCVECDRCNEDVRDRYYPEAA